MKKIMILTFAMACALQILAQKKQLKQIENYVEQTRQDWNIPGIAIGIVKDGEVLMAKGFGEKNADTKAPVDGETIFAVASNTKSFTATSLAMLVEEGKIAWDDKVRKYLPWFELYDPYVSNNITIEDLLCHRNGMDTFSGDLIWYGSNHSRKEVVERAKFLEPSYSFRSEYGYNNIMFIAAGLVIEEVSGMRWEDFVQKRILDPLGMDQTLVSTSQLKPTTNAAAPHNEKNGKNEVIEWVNWDNVAPAGALISSASDMLKWLDFNARKGAIGKGEALLQPETFEDLWAVQTPQKVSSFWREMTPTQHFKGAALGWFSFDLHGKRVVGHGGGYDGMISQTFFVPEENLGVVILTNNINWTPGAIQYYILDVLVGKIKKPTDIAGKFLAFKKAEDLDTAAQKEKAEEARAKDTKPSLPLASYAGTYTDKMYGDLILRVIGDEIAFQFEPTPLFRGTLRHWQNDSFQLNWGSKMMLSQGEVTFQIGFSGEIEGVKIFVDNPDFDFTELDFKKVVKNEND